MTNRRQIEEMRRYRESLWPLPAVVTSFRDKPRRLGLEMEFSGLKIHEISNILQTELGGECEPLTDYEHLVRNTELGDFKVELDYTYLKELGREKGLSESVNEIDDLMEAVVSLFARQVVPYEIISPPLEMDRVWRLEDVVTRLRESGALGTHHTGYYAFGLHFNPEMPSLAASDILAYMQSFMCLFEWLRTRCKLDFSRRITPFIDRFPKAYLRLITASDYKPGMDTLIDDYLQYNPSRNRALDMLPLFTHIDEQRVRAVADDDRVKARPTLHYRLPNCQIDEHDWTIARAWRDWLQVESLAADPVRRSDICEAFQDYLETSISSVFTDWANMTYEWLLPELV